MSDDPRNSGLANVLSTRLQLWDDARKTQELKLLDCYQDKLRIARAEDTAGSGAARARKTQGLFLGSTRNKIRAARAKITDALFGNGQLPFDTSPSNEDLAPFADVTEDVVTDILERMAFRDMLNDGVDTLATYGTGFIFGPFVRRETLRETVADSTAGLKENKYEFDLPYYSLGNTLDCYPDPEARRLGDGLGIFWVTMESKHTVEAWKHDKSYKHIDEALIGPGDNGEETGSEHSRQMRGNLDYWYKNERIKVARFFGKVPKRMLAGGDTNTMQEPDEGEMVDAVIVMAGGVVVKENKSPYAGMQPAKRCAYEEEPHEMWGVGVAENNAPHQKVTNAAFRLFMEGKGMALLGTTAVDRSAFMPTEDFKKFPGKVYQFKPGLSPEQKKAAIMEFNQPDITGGWMDVMRVSEQMSDDDTGITKYTQGDDSRNLNKTATGISMIMSASSLPIKEVIQHIDQDWIEKIVGEVVVWAIKYMTVETVTKIHGEEAGQKWGQIKEFGKTSFIEWKATGTASFMQKEVLANKVRAFADFAMGNPITAPLVDPRELLNQVWDVMQIGKESPILKEEDGAKVPPQVQQQMQQMEQEKKMLETSLQELGEKYNQLEADRSVDEAKIKQDNDKILLDRYSKETDRLKLIYPTMPQQLAVVIAANMGLDVIAEQQEDGQQGQEQEPPIAPVEPPMLAPQPEMDGSEAPPMQPEVPEMAPEAPIQADQPAPEMMAQPIEGQ